MSHCWKTGWATRALTERLLDPERPDPLTGIRETTNGVPSDPNGMNAWAELWDDRLLARSPNKAAGLGSRSDLRFGDGNSVNHHRYGVVNREIDLNGCLAKDD